MKCAGKKTQNNVAYEEGKLCIIQNWLLTFSKRSPVNVIDIAGKEWIIYNNCLRTTILLTQVFGCPRRIGIEIMFDIKTLSLVQNSRLISKPNQSLAFDDKILEIFGAHMNCSRTTRVCPKHLDLLQYTFALTEYHVVDK